MVADGGGGGRGGRKKLVPRGWATVKSKERDGGAETFFSPFLFFAVYLPWLDDRRSLPYK